MDLLICVGLKGGAFIKLLFEKLVMPVLKFIADYILEPIFRYVVLPILKLVAAVIGKVFKLLVALVEWIMGTYVFKAVCTVPKCSTGVSIFSAAVTFYMPGAGTAIAALAATEIYWVQIGVAAVQFAVSFNFWGYMWAWVWAVTIFFKSLGVI